MDWPVSSFFPIACPIRTNRSCTVNSMQTSKEMITAVLSCILHPLNFTQKYQHLRKATIQMLTAPNKSVLIELPYKEDQMGTLIWRRLTAPVSKVYSRAQVAITNRTKPLGDSPTQRKQNDLIYLKLHLPTSIYPFKELHGESWPSDGWPNEWAYPTVVREAVSFRQWNQHESMKFSFFNSQIFNSD